MHTEVWICFLWEEGFDWEIVMSSVYLLNGILDIASGVPFFLF